MKVKSENEVAQSCPTPRNTIDCSPPGSSVHGIFQARVLEWVAIAQTDKVSPYVLGPFSLYFFFLQYRSVIAEDGKSSKLNF